MADFATRAQNAADAGFRARIGVALTKVAIQQSNEAKPRPMWTRKRLDLATTVLRDPQAAAARFALVLASMDVGLGATDAELENFVTQAWDSIAGVGQEDRT